MRRLASVFRRIRIRRIRIRNVSSSLCSRSRIVTRCRCMATTRLCATPTTAEASVCASPLCALYTFDNRLRCGS